MKMRRLLYGVLALREQRNKQNVFCEGHFEKNFVLAYNFISYQNVDFLNGIVHKGFVRSRHEITKEPRKSLNYINTHKKNI